MSFHTACTQNCHLVISKYYCWNTLIFKYPGVDSGNELLTAIDIMTNTEAQNTNSKWDEWEKIARTLSLVAIPIVLAVLGYFFQQGLKEKDVSKDYVELAITILTKSDQSKIDPSIRSWAVDLLNQNSPTKFPNEVSRRLKAGDVSLTETLEVIVADSSGGMAVSPDGQIIAVGGDEGAVHLWNGRTAALVAKLRGHEGRVNSVSFSPDAKLLATGGSDNSVIVWELSNPPELKLTLNGHTDIVIGVAFSPDGKSLYSRSFDSTLRQWSVRDGTQLSLIVLPSFR